MDPIKTQENNIQNIVNKMEFLEMVKFSEIKDTKKIKSMIKKLFDQDKKSQSPERSPNTKICTELKSTFSHILGTAQNISDSLLEEFSNKVRRQLRDNKLKQMELCRFIQIHNAKEGKTEVVTRFGDRSRNLYGNLELIKHALETLNQKDRSNGADPQIEELYNLLVDRSYDAILNENFGLEKNLVKISNILLRSILEQQLTPNLLELAIKVLKDPYPHASLLTDEKK